MTQTPSETSKNWPQESKGSGWLKIFAIATVILLFVVGGYFFLKNRQQASETQPVATIQEATKASSAKQDEQPVTVPSTMLKTLETSGAPTQQQEPSVATYTVVTNDTLIGRFGKDWQAVCTYNKLTDCNLIKAGQVLQLPAGITAKAGQPVTRQPRIERVGPNGEFLWEVVGGAPLKHCGNKDVATINEEAWTLLGLTEEEKAELRTKVGQEPSLSHGVVQLSPGMRFEAVTFCKNGRAFARTPVLAAWNKDQGVFAERFTLASGKILLWVRNCHNWLMGTSAPPEKSDTPRVEPPVTSEPPPAQPAPPVVELPATPAPVVEAPKGFCDIIDPALVVGQEHELPQNGSQADSNFLTAGFYCLRPGKGGMHGFGAKLQASSWDGRVNQGAGRYEGNLYLAGPSYKWMDDDGWDMEVSAPLLGQYRDEFRQDLYRSQRKFSLLGATAGANFYQRRLEGKKVATEGQLFSVLGVPLSRSASHSWDGQSIADTSDLQRFGLYANLGARLWLWEPGWASFYGQAGYFLQTPTSESASLRVGIADPERFIGLGIGHNFDLKNGGDPREAWGWWVDAPKGISVVRAKHRTAQVREEMKEEGVYVDPATRAIKFRNPEKFIGNETPQQ